MRKVIYKTLVNRIHGIAYRYHKIHDGSSSLLKVFSWLYLLWLNFAYYVLFMRFLGKLPDTEYYEEKRIPHKKSESSSYIESGKKFGIEGFTNRLLSYDVVSFDIFDTLIFRPLSQPTDLHYMTGEKLGIPDFKNIRIWAEWDARVKCQAKKGHMEVTLSDIWKNLHQDVGCDADEGMEYEKDLEKKLCYANPFMLKVWHQLRKCGKEIIIVSDMYLPSDVLAEILEKNGFTGYSKLYVSCEHGKNKASGSLFRKVKEDYRGKSIIHVGDNPGSDQEMPGKYGISVLPYQNVNKNMLRYRSYDMSCIIGGAYRGLVSNHLYNGLSDYSMEYEYGYVYGGLFVVGYCSFIHDYCNKNDIDKILFLSRDGDILKQVYDKLYPDDETEYVYWSRKAATKLEAFYDKHDYFRRFIYHKINQRYTLEDILKSMELEFLIDELQDWRRIWLGLEKKEEEKRKNLAYRKLEQKNIASLKKEKMRKQLDAAFSERNLKEQRRKHFIDLKAKDELTEKNGYLLRKFIEAKWDQVLEAYGEQNQGGKNYYSDLLDNCNKAVAVDIGWAGSGATSLDHLVNNEWNINCPIIGVIAGTNTIHSAEPDASEPFLQSGKLVSYLYSQSHNRDLLKKHDPNKDYNVFWELLLSSPTPQFKGFYVGDRRRQGTVDQYMEKQDITLQFGKYDTNRKGIRDIQKGIMDFVSQYREHFGDPVAGELSYMYNISGRDAYAPMLVAASHHEKYLKTIEGKFNLEINVN